MSGSITKVLGDPMAQQYTAALRRIKLLEADNAALRKLLGELQRIPIVPFPDPGAHSWKAFGEAAFRAWSQIRQKVDAAVLAGKR